MRLAQLSLIPLTLSLLLTSTAAARPLRCPPDAVPLGEDACVDTYEASVWRIPASATALVKKLKRGKAIRDDLVAAGATQLCAAPLGNDTCSSCTYGPTFPDTGNWTAPVYAVSIPGVLPSACITWFQAEQACRLSGKRLVTNQEWQATAAGTPDPGAADDGAATCNTDSEEPALAGARTACVSSWGAHDMVGNVWEWVGTWSDLATGTSCTTWGGEFGDDVSCVGPNAPEAVPTSTPAPPGDHATAAKSRQLTAPQPRDIFPVSPQLPGALIRGGNYAAGGRNGVFAIYAGAPPHNRSGSTGFRCAR